MNLNDPTTSSSVTASAVVAAKCLPRWYVRCRDCLSVVAVEPDLPPCSYPDRHVAKLRDDEAATAFLASARCALCDGKFDVMGRVTRDRRMLTSAYDKCACDARCTNARGPSCDCPCSGVNHGTNATVPVVVIESVPRIEVKDAAKARQIAAEWKAELARTAETRPGRLARLSAEGTYLGGADYQLAQAYVRARGHARGLKTHRGRMDVLAKITESGISY